jgi:uncharacterized protein (DUF2147 family)
MTAIQSMRSIVIAAFFLLAASAFAAMETPIGTWRTINDVGQPTGEVEIWEHNGLLYGRIVGIDDPVKRAGVCFKCTDDRKDQPALGLQIMRGMKMDGGRWDGGTILDPETGGIYDASMRLIDGGQKLVLRGFLGISLLGRSQTWVRIR